jgi:hypothetical protein
MLIGFGRICWDFNSKGNFNSNDNSNFNNNVNFKNQYQSKIRNRYPSLKGELVKQSTI